MSNLIDDNTLFGIVALVALGCGALRFFSHFPLLHMLGNLCWPIIGSVVKADHPEIQFVEDADAADSGKR